jgi:hypothetical protein
MEAVRETTVWTGVDYRQPNHDYLLDGDRVVAYRPWGTGEIIRGSGKLKIDRRGRKFEKLEPNPFHAFSHAKREEPVVLEVKGSKGNSYFVNKEEKTCTCPGFTFRGACKHVAELVDN